MEHETTWKNTEQHGTTWNKMEQHGTTGLAGLAGLAGHMDLTESNGGDEKLCRRC